MTSLENVKEYLRVDYEDEDLYINSLIEISEIYIDSMVGDSYKRDEKSLRLAKLLQLRLISDMYEQRSTQVQTNTKQDKIVTSILDKLSTLDEGR